ncbi:MAG: VWA domain-containing protein [Bacteroidota bacterium]|nr:VWA domain-containing protein [Bacteroidota bacterium]MEC8033224.1 VWA domain-containing protein [Bacteroidota bacterium]
MQGFIFHKYLRTEGKESRADMLKRLFYQLLPYVSGDAQEAIHWLNELDRKYHLTTSTYGMGDFIEELKREGLIKEDDQTYKITAKTEQQIRQNALEEVFGKLYKKGKGNHKTPYAGQGEDASSGYKMYDYGDDLSGVDATSSMRNAMTRSNYDSYRLLQEDLVVREREHLARNATVLMIDISHSMILYGEDRITPAKKVAMALAELIRRRYPKDDLDLVVFGNDAWQIEIKELPYLNVGPYHTNTVAGLELAMDLLRRRKNANKQIFMITDGKPTCLKENGQYYKNSFGLDRKVINKTLNLAKQCRRLKIPITTFMIANDPYLQDFVREFTEVNHGKAYYSGLDGLSSMVLEDFERNRKKRR